MCVPRIFHPPTHPPTQKDQKKKEGTNAQPNHPPAHPLPLQPFSQSFIAFYPPKHCSNSPNPPTHPHTHTHTTPPPKRQKPICTQFISSRPLTHPPISSTTSFLLYPSTHPPTHPPLPLYWIGMEREPGAMCKGMGGPSMEGERVGGWALVVSLMARQVQILLSSSSMVPRTGWVGGGGGGGGESRSSCKAEKEASSTHLPTHPPT